ncbi:MAG: hypothetical protein M1814_002314 [Vezdaea aestivalis]|nr:MAG: hypothetical protein M1814_002314 [Vezdaea aestivalis]
MAPNKKKKKASANPARGVATVSIASKPKAEEQQPDRQPEIAPATKKAETTGGHSSTKQNDGGHPAPAPENLKQAELTVEEYELQLEESDLQNYLDQNSQKVKKDVSRQVSRLQTERRVLRSNADPLNIRKWFPQDFSDRILGLVRQENVSERIEIRNVAKSKQISEDEAVTRLWTLGQILGGLGFGDERCMEAIEELVSRNVSSIGGPRDGTWGIEESLDWLSLECSTEELGGYDEISQKKTLPLEEQDDDDPPAQIVEQTVTSDTTTQTNHANETPSDNEPVSDINSDVEPDELLEKHVQTRLAIYRIDPHALFLSSGSKTKQPKRRPTTKAAIPLSKRVTQLIDKLKQIESDALFDSWAAEAQWAVAKTDADRKAAQQRKKQHLARKQSVEQSGHISSDHHPKAAEEISKEAEAASAGLIAEDAGEEEELGLFGDMFANLPEMLTNVSSGTSEMILKESNGISQSTIRDFGKWTGVGPKRILEDTCKARDSGVKIRFSIISSTSWSVRQSVHILWSKSQDPVEPLSIPDFVCKSSMRSTTISMFAVSTPDIAQSEAYCATAALYSLCSTYKSEEKIYLRLPPIWKDLYSTFIKQRKDEIDAQDRLAIKKLRELVKDKSDQDQEDGIILVNSLKKLNANRSGRGTPNNELTEFPPVLPAKAEQMKQLWAMKSSTAAFKRMLENRMQLPIFNFKGPVLEAIDSNQIVIICGETGCGKSTQVPSFVLEHELSHGRSCKIYCTEPRRISAISLAKRVSEEFGEHRNDLGTARSFVGFAIRLEANMTKDTRLVYATTGIVMRMLERSNDLADITHLVLDEVHERSIDSDFLLIVLRKLILKRPELKVILMSATVDAKKFSLYLDNAPILTVPGRTFPVETKYLEDAIEFSGYALDDGSEPLRSQTDPEDVEVEIETSSNDVKRAREKNLNKYSPRTRKTISLFNEYSIDYDFITTLLQKIASDPGSQKYSKAILLFLPGILEIRKMSDMLLGHPMFMKNWYIYHLHSTIASEDQERAFLTPPPGVRKIVLATNIAETGVTIPDVTCVIDTGMHKEMRFDERRQLSRLILAFVSRANAKQRRGRAGRVQSGLCYHLFTKFRHDSIMAEQQTPEMRRLSLQDLVLRVKTCKLGDIEQTLSNALDAPEPKNIRRAIDSLIDVKALTVTEELTPLGQQLARLPLDVHLGKLILLGCIFGCLDMALSVAAILSSKSPFQGSFNNRSQADGARLSFKQGNSDVLTIYAAYCAWRKVCLATGASESQFCRKYYLSSQILSNIEDLKAQLLVSVVDANFLSLGPTDTTALAKARFQSSRTRYFVTLPPSAVCKEGNDIAASSVIAWAFYPKLILRDGKGWRNISNNQSVSLHPASVNKGNQVPKFLSYYHMMQSSNKFYNAHETTIAHALPIAVLGGEASFNAFSGIVIIDGNRLKFSLPDPKSLLALKALRLRLRDACAKLFKFPDRPLPSQLLKWLDIWNDLCQAVKSAEERTH